MVGSDPVSSERDMRRLCRGLLDELGVRPPLGAEKLCRRLAEARGRPIELVGREVPAGAASGVLVAFPDRDLIVYQTATTPDHQAHIIFHEVIHLVRGHLLGDAEGVCGALQEPGPSPSGDQPTLYDQWQEWEAETGATILSGWAAATTPAGSAGPVPGADSGEAQSAVDRLTSGLGGAWQWL